MSSASKRIKEGLIWKDTLDDSFSESLDKNDDEYVPEDESYSSDEYLNDSEPDIGGHKRKRASLELHNMAHAPLPLSKEIVVEDWNTLRDQCKNPMVDKYTKYNNNIAYDAVVDLCKGNEPKAWEKLFPYPSRNDKESSKKVHELFTTKSMDNKHAEKYASYLMKPKFRDLICSLVLKIADATNQLGELEIKLRKKLEGHQKNFTPKIAGSWKGRLAGFEEPQAPKENNPDFARDSSRNTYHEIIKADKVSQIALRRYKRSSRKCHKLAKDLEVAKDAYEKLRREQEDADKDLIRQNENCNTVLEREATIEEFTKEFKTEDQFTFAMKFLTKLHADIQNTQLNPEKYFDDILFIVQQALEKKTDEDHKF